VLSVSDVLGLGRQQEAASESQGQRQDAHVDVLSLRGEPGMGESSRNQVPDSFGRHTRCRRS
jgi:hypothetical protein